MRALLGALLLFAATLCLTPGPPVMRRTAPAATFGIRRAIAHILGITLGVAVMVLAVGLGLIGLFQAEPGLHEALKYAGAAYLLYLAWRIARADGPDGDGERARPISFV